MMTSSLGRDRRQTEKCIIKTNFSIKMELKVIYFYTTFVLCNILVNLVVPLETALELVKMGLN
jgi:hypothetical protein